MSTLALNSATLILEYSSGISAYALARRYGVSPWAVLKRLRDEGTVIRASSAEKTLKLDGVQTQQFVSLASGLLLGDGSIDSRKGAIRIEQSNDRLGWLQQICDTLAEIGVYSRIIPVRSRIRYIGKRALRQGPSSQLYTSACKEIRELRRQWYGGNLKRIPHTLRLDPYCSALWFCGDGSPRGESGGLRLYTNGFVKEDTERLVGLLQADLGVRATLGKSSRPGQFTVNILAKKDAVRFKDIVLPFVPECCLYKLRFVDLVRPKTAFGC